MNGRSAWVAAASSAALVAGLVVTGVPSAPQPACGERVAWAGSETTSQGGGTLLAIPVAAAMTLTGVDVSIGFAQREDALPGFSEVLTLVGVSRGPVVMDGAWPVLPASADFGANIVTTTDGSSHNENPAVSNAVIGSSIIKTRAGFGSDRILADVDVQLIPGDVIWVNYDSISIPHVALDPEVQVTVHYTPTSCP